MKTGIFLILTITLALACNVKPDLEIADLDADADADGDSDADGDVDSEGDSESEPIEDFDLGLGEAIPMDCGDCDGVGGTMENMICAVDLCDPDVVKRNFVWSPMYFPPAESGASCSLVDTYEAINHFGLMANDLAPHLGNSYAIMGSGVVRAIATDHDDKCTNGLALPGSLLGYYTDWDTEIPVDTETDTDSDTTTDSQTDTEPDSESDSTPFTISDYTEVLYDPFDVFSEHQLPIFDVVRWTITLTAPEEARAFSLKYVFFSAEYDDWISSSFNDKFYIVMNAPITTSGRDQVINYTNCRDPNRYYDFTGSSCDTVSGYCCYVAINSALSDCCWYPYGSPHAPNPNAPACYGDPVSDNTNIAGTGFVCATELQSDGTDSGSSTGWLQTAWPVEPGETFTLTFQIHDTNDAAYDSQVILDSFRFHRELTEGGGTIAIPVE